MPKETRMTSDTISRLAEIAGLNLDESRAAELAPQVQAIREDIRMLGTMDLTDVEPLSLYRPESADEC
jgi:Asp-tRNA(Asn)/Glu-tRNA(Gln) amidotransferase C subunit